MGYPADVRQINGILEDGTLCIFKYNGPLNFTDNWWRGLTHEYVYKIPRVETKVFKLPCSWAHSEKTVDMLGSFTYDDIRTIDVTFANNTMNGKIRREITNNRNHRNRNHYSFQCPRKCGRIIVSSISYSTRNDALRFEKVFNNNYRCNDCKTSFFSCCCYQQDIFKKFEHRNFRPCLRCYNDNRSLVKRKAQHIEFLKCDIEIFFDKYFNRLKPWILKRMEKNNGSQLRRCDRTTTLPYPSTFQDIKKRLLFLDITGVHKFNKKKHNEEMFMSPPTLQQICVFNVVQNLLQKKVIDEDENAAATVLDVLPDDDVKEDIEMLYTFLEQRVVKKDVYVFTGGEAGREESVLENFKRFDPRTHPIYKRYYHP